MSYHHILHFFGRWSIRRCGIGRMQILMRILLDEQYGKGNIMFEKKDIIFSETLGVCQVAELTRLSAKNGDQVLYYGLRSVFDKAKVSYIPVDHHQVQLRNLISYEEAEKFSENPPENQTEHEKREVEYILLHKLNKESK